MRTLMSLFDSCIRICTIMACVCLNSLSFDSEIIKYMTALRVHVVNFYSTSSRYDPRSKCNQGTDMLEIELGLCLDSLKFTVLLATLRREPLYLYNYDLLTIGIVCCILAFNSIVFARLYSEIKQRFLWKSLLRVFCITDVGLLFLYSMDYHIYVSLAALSLSSMIRPLLPCMSALRESSTGPSWIYTHEITS